MFVEILAAAVVTQFLVLVGQTIITLVFILGVFGIPCHGPLGWVIALTLLQGCAGMCLGEQRFIHDLVLIPYNILIAVRIIRIYSKRKNFKF
jgi:hypothetical protein